MSDFYDINKLPKGKVTIKKPKKVRFLKTVNAKQHLAKSVVSEIVAVQEGTIYGWIWGEGTEHTFKDKAGDEWTVYLEYKRPYYLPYEKTTGLYIPIYGKTKDETIECLSRMEFKNAMDHNKPLIEYLDKIKHYLEAHQ